MTAIDPLVHLVFLDRIDNEVHAGINKMDRYKMKTERTDNQLKVFLAGRIDSFTAPALEADLIKEVENNVRLVADLGDLRFISSAGLRVLLAVHKKLAAKGSLSIINVPAPIMEIFTTTGFTDIMHIEPMLRQVSIAGLECIARGVTGECYRVDDETLLKLYFEHVSDEIAEREKAYARAAFVAGLPTAISYDIVAHERRKGILYEMLNAKTLSQLIVENPDRLEELVRMFSDVCKLIHTTKGNPAVFSRTRDACQKAIQTVDFLDDKQRSLILEKVLAIPEVDTCVHGDLHTSNILIQDGEPRLIDLGDFSLGHPMFDVGQIYNIFYCSRQTHISERAVGMEPELAFRVWELFERYYFDSPDEEQREDIRQQAFFFGCLRLFMFYEAFGRDENMKNWLVHKYLPTL